MTASVSDLLDLRPDKLAAVTTEKLEELLRYHNARYWQYNAPEISDTDYDRLLEALRRRAPDSPVLQDLGPSQFGKEVLHPRAMLSLEKAYELKDLQAFIETPKTKKRKIFGDLVVSPKIDGVACSLRYDASGKLVLAATRGDGKHGEDISANARRVASIIQQLDAQAVVPCEVRGELYMPRSRFAQKYAVDFVNARNLCAGAIKQKDADKSAAYGLAFFAYELLDTKLPSEMQKLDELSRLGFDCPAALKVGSDDIDAIWRAVQHTKTISDSMDCDTDGVVLKVDSVAEQRALGLTAHHPSYAIAFKFQAERGESTLLRLHWSVARTGRITPVAVVDPVFLSGASVNRASLHNLEVLEKIGLTCGCRVEMSRRGEVIPQIEGVIEAGDKPCKIPEKCPSCGGPVLRRDQFLYCQQADSCPDALVGTLKHFCKILDIDGFGDKLLSGLVQEGLVRKPADFFTLNRDALLKLRETSESQDTAQQSFVPQDEKNAAQHPENLVDKDVQNSTQVSIRMGEKLADKLVAAVQMRRQQSLIRFLAALGIDDLGPVMAEKLADHLHDLAAIRAASVEQLQDIEGFGDERARHIVEGLQQMSARIDALLLQVQIKASETKPPSDHFIAGKSVVFTGKMALMDRKSGQKKLRELGAKTPAAVSKDLDFLVIGDLGSPLLGPDKKSGKHITADKLIAKGAKISIVSEAKFWDSIDTNKAR